MARKLTQEEIIGWLKLNKPEFELCEGNIYERSDKKLKFFHNLPECLEIFEMIWDNIHFGFGCPVCSGKQIGKRNSLAYLRPDLVKEWHPENELKPEEVTLSSGKKAYWICSVCGYGKDKEWYIQIYNRGIGKGCPACSNPPKVLTDRNRLSLLNPDIAAEWDYVLNEDTPNDVSFGSSKKRWWICPKGHSYFSSIKDRVRGRRCNQCNASKGENSILFWVNKNNANLKDIEFLICIPQKRFPNCKKKRELPFDFGLEFYNEKVILIEYYGEQHYFPVNFSNRGTKYAEKEFKIIQENDKIKQKYCKDNNLPLLIIPYWEFDNIEHILEQTLFG